MKCPDGAPHFMKRSYPHDLTHLRRFHDGELTMIHKTRYAAALVLLL
jgi:hypothetical protein